MLLLRPAAAAGAAAAAAAVNAVMTSVACQFVMIKKLVLWPAVHFSSRRLLSDYVTHDL